MMLDRPRRWAERLLTSGSAQAQRPSLGKGYESSLKGVHVIGDLAGAPVIKLAMAQGVEVIEHIAKLPEMRRPKDGDRLDVLVVGAGASGLNAALAAQERGLETLVLEKGRIANTIENFPEGKWVYAEPDAVPPKGKLWLDGSTKEDLVARWNQIVTQNGLEVRCEEPLLSLERMSDGSFLAKTPKGEHRAAKVILATGQRGNPRKLEVPGEELEHVYHRLYSPRKYRDEDILVVGGGNSAVEAALVLSEQNRVVLSYRGKELSRLFRGNRDKLSQAIEEKRIEVILESRVARFGEGTAQLIVGGRNGATERELRTDHAFVLIGAAIPADFLRGLGIRLENEWEGSAALALGLSALLFLGLAFFGALLGGAPPLGLSSLAIPGGLLSFLALAGLFYAGARGNRWAWLGLSFFLWYSIYGIKVGKGEELWPYRGWGYSAVSFAGRPWSFWYTVLYTSLMTVFGLQALKRWGLGPRDKLQIWRYTSLIAFQWIFFFLVPEFLFQWAVEYQWVGELARDPQFADQAWRSYGLVYAWPLFFYTWLYHPHQIWVVWGVVLSFGIIPLFALFHGKRYCSWICGCGGLAETLGDRWRHLAPKGPRSIRLEWMGTVVLILASLVTVAMLTRDVSGLARTADLGMSLYRILVDVWLVGILPVTLYPFMGGKVWCRYWCPLAKLMQLSSMLWTKLGWSRFHIVANDKCIACNECSRNCQVGIDVMQVALREDTLDNGSSSCIGCGVCVSVCPMDVLSYSPTGRNARLPIVS